MSTIETVPMFFVLWFRVQRGQPWEALGQFTTEREAVNAMTRAGDFCVLPAGKEP